MLKFTPNGKRAFVAACVVQVMITWILAAVPTIAPLITDSFHISDALLGIFLALCYAGTCLGSLVGGTLIRRYGPLRMSQVCLLSSAIALLGMTIPSLWILAVLAFLLGFGDGPVMPAASDLLYHNVSKQNIDFSLSLKQATAPVGTAIAGVSVPFLALHFDWRASLTVVAIVAVAISLWLSIYHKTFDDHDEPNKEISFKAIKESLDLVMKVPVLRRISIMGLIYQGLQVCVLGFFVIFLVRKADFSVVFAGLALSCINIGAISGRVLWGYIASKTHKARLSLGVIGILMGVCLIALTFVEHDWNKFLLLLLCFVSGNVCLGWKGVFLAEIAKNAPNGRVSEVTGGGNFVSFSGAVLVPIVFGLLLHATSAYEWSFWLISIACVLAGLWMLAKKDPVKPINE